MLREIKYVTKGYFDPKCKKIGPLGDGWFHGFYQDGDNEYGLETIAVVETTTGECILVGVRQIKFVDQPPEEDQEILSEKFVKFDELKNKLTDRLDQIIRALNDLVVNTTKEYY